MDKINSGEDTHVWWWEMDKERQTKEAEAGLEEPEWKMSIPVRNAN